MGKKMDLIHKLANLDFWLQITFLVIVALAGVAYVLLK
jgi:hypothetical protein